MGITKNKIKVLIMIVLVMVVTGCTVGIDDTYIHNDKVDEVLEKVDEVEKDEIKREDTKREDTETIQEGTIEVHYIDVGQGDSILIKQGEVSMLIDAGENHYGKTVVKYIQDQGINKLDYVIGTHPHSDHIGGLDDVINSFDIGKVIMPNVTHTTKTFEDVLMAMKNKGLTITIPEVGSVNGLGDAKITIIAPNSSEYSNLNNYSVGIKLEYGENSFVFAGDAEVISEKEMATNGINIEADVLKLCHHGSDTSSTEIFLEAVKPSYAVIQLGKDNKYNHPDGVVLDRLNKRNVEIYRNDLQGTIIVEGNGKDLKFNTTPTEKVVGNTVYDEVAVTEDYEEYTQEVEGNYIGNKKSKIYHLPSCGSLPGESNRVYFESMEEVGLDYVACKKCKP